MITYTLAYVCKHFETFLEIHNFYEFYCDLYCVELVMETHSN
jgi:hypothetical protein